MEWQNGYVIMRPEASGTMYLVHGADKMKDARYWLQYIGAPGDAIFTTRKNPQHKGPGETTYLSHLISRGKLGHSEADWKTQVFEKKTSAEVVVVDPPSPSTPGVGSTKSSDSGTVDARQLSDGKPRPYPLKTLAELVRGMPADLRLTLAEPTKWINWESALTLMVQDVFVVAVDPAAKWPLSVTMKYGSQDSTTMDYNPEMKFVVREAKGK